MLFLMAKMAFFGVIYGLIALIIGLIRKMPRADIIYIVLFAAYIGALFAFTLVRGVNNAGQRFQLIPLITLFTNLERGRMYHLLQMAVNVGMFIPMGIFCGIKMASAKKTVMAGSLVSLFIETIQLISGHGIFDVDDLILNTIGTAIGLLIIKKLFRGKQDGSAVKEDQSVHHCRKQ
ncbi:MAG: VanZ family protein [Firmicutes bacterium]|nr:VanZ family protein [Bacillota bacterium]